MARRRMIDPGIWQSEDFSKLSLLAKLTFIGMFSLADDEGKGRAKPVYLKSIIFPYDDGMRIIDVEKALSEIGSNMSVTFYAHDGNTYYKLDNWLSWQRVDKPQPSKIPEPKADEALSRIIPESFWNDSGLKEKKLKEENIFSCRTSPDGDSDARSEFEKNAMLAAEYMAKRIISHTPSFPPLQGDKREQTVIRWAADIEKLLRIDKVDFGEFKQVLQFSQTDSFWQKNILSGKKLREQYPALLVKIGGDRND